MTPRCAATPLNWSNAVMRACWENDMSAELLMYWRVLIYSSDYKHPDLCETPRRHTALRGEWTHLGCTLWLYISVYTKGSLGRARHRTNYTNNVSISLPHKVDTLQYSETTRPFSGKQKCACEEKIGYSFVKTFGGTTNHRVWLSLGESDCDHTEKVG